MSQVRLVGRGGVSDEYARDLFLSVVDDLHDWNPDLSAVHRPFTVLCALDADGVDVNHLWDFATRLLDAGCMYVCAWGPRCEWVHDVFDAALVGETGELPYGEDVMTTWHNDESLDEALWFAIYVADLPDASIRSVLAVASPPHAAQLERRLADTDQLSQDVLVEDE